LSELIDFHLPYGFDPRPLEPEVESADPGEQGAVGERAGVRPDEGVERSDERSVHGFPCVTGAGSA